MPTISLLVTGKTELKGLGALLGRLFPADFRYANASDQELRGFTSRDCREILDAPWSAESDLAWFVSHMVAEAFPGRHGDPPDLVIGVDDVELVNAGKEGVVVQVVRDAVRAHVEASFSGPARDRVYVQLRNRCSFHLLKPMVESYFFCEQGALDRAGRAASRTSRFAPADCDPEQFVVDDPEYIGVPEPRKPQVRKKSIRAILKQDWRFGAATRPRHPKKYIQFLCDEAGDGATAYRETTGGADALRALSWSHVLARPDQVPLLRSLLADISRLVEPRPELASLLAPGEPRCATWPPPQNNLLRNI